MAFFKNASLSRFSLGFSSNINMEGDTEIMALIQFAGFSLLFLFKLLLDYIKRRNRASTVAPNHLAAIPAAAVAPNHLDTISVVADVDQMT
ncbi:hypothetical protein ES288_D04G038000v1 [Gossypium darwinii]|uniref:Uncharacterized protein n=1 Tax=Gossypium darwinii TaxID=34276 RepID=A0A5D2CWN5_GOSDA|nr:hypothetical protein ES288_D04G038000v1 [Gossypium darwinii]TYG72642.1 hypothetical protein ES288_D04G038000v1 [Gossypium darwinii]